MSSFYILISSATDHHRALRRAGCWGSAYNCRQCRQVGHTCLAGAPQSWAAEAPASFPWYLQACLSFKGFSHGQSQAKAVLGNTASGLGKCRFSGASCEVRLSDDRTNTPERREPHLDKPSKENKVKISLGGCALWQSQTCVPTVVCLILRPVS